MTPSADGILRGALATVLAATVSACASHGPTQPQFLSSPVQARGSAGPMEQMNRSVFDSNQQINHAVIYPVAKTYRDTVPEPVRDSISAFTENLGEPFVFANNILQLRFPAAAATLGRFLVNSTVGIGGLIDVASTEGLARQTGDFGQTLYVWGVRDSDYVILPLVGPTTVRDAFGNGVELAGQIFLGTILPVSAATAANHVGTAGAVASPIASLSKVEQMQELEQSSLDFYSMMRSVVEQKRQAELSDALRESPLSALPGLEDRSGGAVANSLLVSPALSSPALNSPALQSPALSSPALDGLVLTSPPVPAEKPGAKPASSSWILVIERPRAGG